MRRFLIALTLGLVVLCFVKGSQGDTPDDTTVISALNRTVDERIDQRLLGMRLGAELSAGLNAE